MLKKADLCNTSFVERSNMHRELQALFDQDQADRQGFACFDQDQRRRMLQRDAARRKRVEALLASNPLLDAEDYFHAAMIFQHGEIPEHFWLMAAAYDRWLMRQGQAQKYGTQYIIREGGWTLYDVDPTTTDAQRACWNVPPLAQCLQRAEEMNETIFSTAI
jgi:hypothetical protein